MTTGVERDLAEVLALQAVLVHVALGVHTHPVRSRHGMEWDEILHRATNPAASRTDDAGTATGGLRCRFVDGAEDEHVVGQAARDGGDGVEHGTQLCRHLATTGEPVDLESQCVFQFGHTGGCHSRRRVHGAGVRRHAVDVITRESGIGDRRKRGLHRERDTGAAELAADGRLADTGDDGVAFAEYRSPCGNAHEYPFTGRNSGSQMSSAA